MSRIAAQVEGFEDRVPHVYQDSLGWWTIGVGFLVDKRKGGGLRDEEIDFILNNRVKIALREIGEHLPWTSRLNEPRISVLVNMWFQLGLAGLLGFKNALRAMEDERWETAEAEMLDSTWHEQTPRRCAILARQMMTGEWQT
jgi:lysozyme